MTEFPFTDIGRVYFKNREFICHCDDKRCQAKLYKPDERLAAFLDVLRAAAGRAININSGWRCESHNGAVGGAQSSLHLTGRAADISFLAGGDLHALFNTAKRLSKLPEFQLAELLFYERYIHIAV
jgi:hypothetical protein